MDHHTGLDISVKETSICIVDADGHIVHELKVPSEPEPSITALTIPGLTYKRMGLEAGPLSRWLYGALTAAGLPAI